MHAHRIEPHYACIALNISDEEAAALVDCGVIPKGFDDQDRERLDRFLNFLIRVEWKLKVSAEIRRTLELPHASLGNRSPAQIFDGSDEEMRRLRDAGHHERAQNQMVAGRSLIDRYPAGWASFGISQLNQ